MIMTNGRANKTSLNRGGIVHELPMVRGIAQGCATNDRARNNGTNKSSVPMMKNATIESFEGALLSLRSGLFALKLS